MTTLKKIKIKPDEFSIKCESIFDKSNGAEYNQPQGNHRLHGTLVDFECSHNDHHQRNDDQYEQNTHDRTGTRQH